MFFIPADILENVQNIDWGQLADTINRAAPVVQTVKDVWTKDTLQELINGNAAVPDKVINEALAKEIINGCNKDIKSVTVTSHANGRLDIKADTVSMGRIELSGTIEKFVHNRQESAVVYRVKERALKDHGLLSWFVSRISLSMAEKLLGKVTVSDNLPVNIKGNNVTVDLKKILETSKLASNEVNGHRLLDMVEIEEAVPKEGYIAVKTKFLIPDDIKEILKNLTVR